MTDAPARLLNDAADLLEVGGWCQLFAEKRGLSGTVLHCVTGALTAVGKHGYTAATKRAADMRLMAFMAVADPAVPHRHQVAWQNAQTGVIRPLFAEWNDVAERTPQQVLAMLRGAAEWQPPQSQLNAERAPKEAETCQQHHP